MLAESGIVATVCTARMARHGIQVVGGMRSMVVLCGKGRQIKSFHGILHQGGQFGSETFLREPLEVNHKVLRKTLDAEELPALLSGLAVATGRTLLAIQKFLFGEEFEALGEVGGDGGIGATPAATSGYGQGKIPEGIASDGAVAA